MQISTKIVSKTLSSKKRFILGLIFYSILLSCSSSKQYKPDGWVDFVEQNRDTVVLRAVDYGLTAESAITNAIELAFDELLFKGFPNSPYRKGISLLANRNELLSKNKKYYDLLYNEKRYKKFLIETKHNKPNSDKSISNGFVVSDIVIKINLANLYEDLKTHNVLQKFGY